MKRPPVIDRGSFLIYDGECDFCKAWLAWLHKRLTIASYSFHEIDPTKYGLTLEQCREAVQLVTPSKNYSGADAIGELLKLRGNRFSARVIRLSGPLARFGYRWVASHRNSFLIRQWTNFLNLYCE
jgi:predicted DCC family thiol-disulfide oxidoreductase YuxK